MIILPSIIRFYISCFLFSCLFLILPPILCFLSTQFLFSFLSNYHFPTNSCFLFFLIANSLFSPITLSQSLMPNFQFPWNSCSGLKSGMSGCQSCNILLIKTVAPLRGEYRATLRGWGYNN